MVKVWRKSADPHLSPPPGFLRQAHLRALCLTWSVFISWLSAQIAHILKGPFSQAIFVAQLNVIFVALKLQPAAISSRFKYSLSVQNVIARLFLKQRLCAYWKVKLLLKVTVFQELYLIGILLGGYPHKLLIFY